MTSKNPKMIARTVRATVQATAATVLFVVQFIAVHTAQAQIANPALFVAPEFLSVAASAGTPAPLPAVGAAARPVQSDGIKPSSPAASAAALAACTAREEYSQLDRPLLHTMRQLASGKPLTIVAIGSSSTAGAGASSPAANYPSQLAEDLRQRFPGHDITVLNRGVNGEETDDMMARFAPDVMAAHPQLVLWQVGTNSVLRDRPLGPHSTRLRDGIEELKNSGADVVLIDPQFSPAVVAKPEIDGMVEQIALAAKEQNVDLFRRFAIMREWHEIQHLPFATFVSPDQLHMNDWGYGCWAKVFADAISEAATRPITSAAAHAAPPANSR
jgi:acyl-CoA thioesterase-1